MARHQPPDVRRAQLFEAAMRVCAEKGYHATTVVEIASRAGLSKGALYHHFKSKQELFVSLLEESMDMFARMIDALTPSGSTRDALRQVLRAALAAYPPETRSGMVEFMVLCLREPAFRERFVRHYQGMVEAGARLVQRGVERGELRAGLDADRASRLFFFGTDGLMVMLTALGRGDEADQAAIDLLDCLLDGFAARSAGAA